MVQVFQWQEEFSFLSVCHMARLATSAKKKLVIASVKKDERDKEEISYQILEWSGVT
jgi:tRNA splicing endonuclease